MKNSILFVAVLMLVAVPFSSANARHGFRGGGSSSSISIGVNGGTGSFYYSQQNYSRSVNNSQKTVIRAGNNGYYGGHQSVYYGGGDYYGSGRQNHIHRQEGRRYINDYPRAPVVVVPATNRHHRHYRGCGCRY